MKRSHQTILSIFVSFFFAANVDPQEIPNDPNSLPKMIGGRNSNNNRIDTVTVSGKVIIDGLSVNQARPFISVVVYSSGRLVVRQQVSENGSYSIDEVPREGATLHVEVDHVEITSRQIMYSPARVIFQDFNISLPLVEAARSKAAVVSAASLYERNRENQDRFERAVSDINKGKTDNAIQLLKAVLNEDSKDHQAWTQIANAYFLKKDHQNAEDAYLKAIAIFPNSLQALVNLGRLYILQNKFEKAIEIFTRAVAVEPTSPTAQRYLGEAYLGIRKGSIAVSYLNEAIRLAPIEMAEVHLRLAALYNGAGLKPRAAAEYQKFLGKVPNYEKRDELKKYIAENPPAQ